MRAAHERWRRTWTNNAGYARIFYQRAVGELPEMESSKAAAALLKAHVRPGDRVLDVGCGGGHYLRSLRKVIRVPFSYTGVDATPLFIDTARRAWKGDPGAKFLVGDIFDLPFDDGDFDLVLCNNVLYHLPRLVRPMEELLRVTRRLLQARTLVGTRSYRIQEVFSSAFYATDVAPEEEFEDDGEPRSFSYLNIHSRRYFEGVVRRFQPDARVEYIEDTFFDPRAIERSARREWKNPNPTYMLGGKQVSGYIVLPFHFVKVHKPARPEHGGRAPVGRRAARPAAPPTPRARRR